MAPYCLKRNWQREWGAKHASRNIRTTQRQSAIHEEMNVCCTMSHTNNTSKMGPIYAGLLLFTSRDIRWYVWVFVCVSECMWQPCVVARWNYFLGSQFAWFESSSYRILHFCLRNQYRDNIIGFASTIFDFGWHLTSMFSFFPLSIRCHSLMFSMHFLAVNFGHAIGNRVCPCQCKGPMSQLYQVQRITTPNTAIITTKMKQIILYSTFHVWCFESLCWTSTKTQSHSAAWTCLTRVIG